MALPGGRVSSSEAEGLSRLGESPRLAPGNSADREKDGQLLSRTQRFQVAFGYLLGCTYLKGPVAVVIIAKAAEPSAGRFHVEALAGSVPAHEQVTFGGNEFQGKSPVRGYRPPGSVRGASGNRRPYLDNLGS
jgi:hypothetical protein